LGTMGLASINVGLNSFNEDNFKAITGVDGLKKVRQGIERLLESGFSNLKINTVLLKDYNETEAVEIARLTLKHLVTVRFIEYMPCGNWDTNADSIVKCDEIIKRITEKTGKLIKMEEKFGNGPAQYYRLPDARGKIGFIMPVSHPFCADCNRLRLTADGYLKSCLLSEEEIDTKPILRGVSRPKELEETIKKAVLMKPFSHSRQRNSIMSRIGG
jgi:GTP 3',8-cyclase